MDWLPSAVLHFTRRGTWAGDTMGMLGRKCEIIQGKYKVKQLRVICFSIGFYDIVTHKSGVGN